MAIQPFNRASNGPIIHDGFGSGINALNRSIVSEHMVPFAGGRAYAKPDTAFDPDVVPAKPYAAAIHALSYAEMPPARLLAALAQKRKEYEGSIYMGAAGFLNLSYIAASRPGAAILYDVNPMQTWFWNHILPMIAENDTGEKFMDALVADSKNIQKSVGAIHTQTGRSRNVLAGILSEEERMELFMYKIYASSPLDVWRQFRKGAGLEWVDDAEGYDHIRQMARRDAIGALTLDALDEKAWAEVAAYLKTQTTGAPKHVKNIYISNIMHFLDHGIDFTLRKDELATREHLRKVVTQVLDPESHGIITDLADPAMGWAESEENITYRINSNYEY